MGTFVDAIDDYSAGASGTITTNSGTQVGYTVSGNGGNFDSGTPSGIISDGVGIGSATGWQSVEVDFDEPIKNAMISVAEGDVGENYMVLVDGQEVNLSEMIANGDATFTPGGAGDTSGTNGNYYVNSDGHIANSGHYWDGSYATIEIHIPVNSIGVAGAVDGGSGWDVFEFGISTDTDVVCFCEDTLIATPNGDVPIQNLDVGARVLTRDNGAQPIRWIGQSNFSFGELRHTPNLRPIQIDAGALGSGLPKSTLSVSRQHRILIQSKIVERMFNTSEVLIAAAKLLDVPGVRVDGVSTGCRYYHLLCDQHEIVFANGLPAETLLLGAHARRTLGPEALEEIALIFPDLITLSSAVDAARTIPPTKRANRLVERHINAGKAFVNSGT